ncbi:MAG: DEAD/DEAH box helicase [Patescibacteria group bacterium]|nr:DEAD/DEAH box helicase [Patescibacteria group bacterium]
MLKKEKTNVSSFKDLNINPGILSLLEKNGLETPTPIQAKAIPVALTGKDLIGVAQTGTGKTLAFGIPLVERLSKNKSKALVLLPTRELATQVEESLRTICLRSGLRTISLIGGEPINRQMYSLKYNPRIIIATPGRLLDHYKRKTIHLDDVSILVLDEADMMFDLGFAPQIEEIIKLTPTSRQTLLFSATMPAPIIKLAEKYLKTPLQIEVAPAGTTAELIDQEIYLVHQNDRLETLKKILIDYKNLVLIFVRTKHGASNLTEKLKYEGHQVSEIHSNLSFGQRKTALASFKNGTKRILVATDVAARGLDIKDIQLVLNFDLPDNSEDYVHRIGRTARAGKGGKAISFALPHQRREIQRIERLIRKNLPLLKIGSLKSLPEKSIGMENRSSSRFASFNRNNKPNLNRFKKDQRSFSSNEKSSFARKEVDNSFSSDSKSNKNRQFSKFKGPEKNDFSRFKSSGKSSFKNESSPSRFEGKAYKSSGFKKPTSGTRGSGSYRKGPSFGGFKRGKK